MIAGLGILKYQPPRCIYCGQNLPVGITQGCFPQEKVEKVEWARKIYVQEIFNGVNGYWASIRVPKKFIGKKVRVKLELIPEVKGAKQGISPAPTLIKEA